MAQIVHENPDVDSVGHQGSEYHADEHGIFDVPAEVADDLVKFPLWSRFTGRKKAAAASSGEVGDLHAEVKALREDVDKLLAAATEPAPPADPPKK